MQLEQLYAPGKRLPGSLLLFQFHLGITLSESRKEQRPLGEGIYPCRPQSVRMLVGKSRS